MKTLFAAFAITSVFLFQNISLAQDNYRKGYIITNENDTIYGLLQNRSSKQAGRQCNFKQNEEAETSSYLPGQIIGYRFDEGKYYISKIITQYGQEQTVFLEFLIKGKANFYALNDNEGSRFFIETEKDGFVELTDHEKIVRTDSGTFYSSNKYMGKLLYIMADYPQLATVINQTDLQSKPLIHLAKEYQTLACPTEECTVFEKRFKPVSVGISFHGGVVMKNLNMGDRIISDNRIGFCGGASIRFRNILYSNERISLETGINLIKNNTFIFKSSESNTQSEKVIYYDKGYYINKFDEVYFSDNYIKVKSLETETKISTLSIPVIVHYSFLSKKLRPGMGIGGIFSFVTSQNENLNYEFFSDRYGKTFPDKLAGFVVNASLKYKTGTKSSLELDLKYLIESSLGDVNQFYRYKTKSILAQIRYNFYW
jgi:hypothetical protein